MSFIPLIPQGKAGENTWNARLAEALRARGFASADFELHFPILSGRPRKPDVALANGGTHLISGKLGESKEFDAFSSAQEYQQLISATTNLGEVFAVVYPSSRKESFIVHLLANPEHERKVWRVDAFDDAVEIICKAIEKRIDDLKRPLEPLDASVVRLLRQGVEVLHVSARKADEEKLKEVFGGASFFDSVLSESIPEGEHKDVLSRAASFLFVNQILFYSILRRETESYDPIDAADMSSPVNIRSKYFARVLKKDYRPIFEIDVASLFDPESSKDGCLRIVRLIQELVRSVSTHDIIGKVFHEIIPLEFRKMVAAFYTNSAAGDLLANLSIHSPDVSILDPACGSGTLLVSAYRRKKALARAKQKGAFELHKEFVEKQLTGLDVMAFSAHLAAVQLLLQEPLNYTERLRIGTIDSTQVHPNMIVEPFGDTIRDAFRQRRMDDFESGHHEIKKSELTKSGAVVVGQGSSERFTLTKADVVIMNPPFTSSRRMPKTYKDELKRRFRLNPRYVKLVKGNVGYHLYFVCIADKFLSPGGRMALVVPFTTLVGGDFSELTRFLVQEYSIEFIVSGQGRSAFSENTAFSEILFVARKNSPEKSHRSVLLLTKTSPISWSHDDVIGISTVAQQCANTGVKLDTELCTAVPFHQNELLPEKKTLTRLVADLDETYKTTGIAIHPILEKSPAISTLAQLTKDGILQLKVAEVVHGKSDNSEGHSLTRFGGDSLVACRTEDRALMKHDRLIYHGGTRELIRFRDKATGDIFDVPRAAVSPALRRFAYIDRFELTGWEDFVIERHFSGARKLFDSILGKEKAESAFEAFRKEWGPVVESGSSRLCVPGRINLAAPGSKLLAIRDDEPIFMCSFMWGISGLEKTDEKIIVLWFNSALFLYLLLARLTVTEGSWVKLHSKQLMKMQILNPSKLNKLVKRRLVSLYDDLAHSEWPSLVEQYTSFPEERKRLDLEILRSLGITDEHEANRMIHLIYDSIAKALRTMRNTMGVD